MIEKYSIKYPLIYDLLCGYFNQDWNCDYDSPEEVIRTFARDGSKKDLEKAIQELRILLKEEHTSKEWEQIIYHNFGCEYRPDYKENTLKEWLEMILKQFEEELILAKDD